MTNRIGSSISTGSSLSNPNISSRTNIITNRQTTRSTTNNSIPRNNIITNRSKEIANSTNRASQPVVSPNTRISSELSSHIGDTLGTQPKPTTNVGNRKNSSSRTRVFLPFDRESSSQRTSPQTNAQQPAASSNNRVNSESTSRIATQINTQNNSQSRNTRQETNRVTPPLNSERQPVESTRSISSIDRANTDIGILISPEGTTPKESRQSAANPNSRTTRNNLRIGGRIGENDTSLNDIQIRSYVGDSQRTNSNAGNALRKRDESKRTTAQKREQRENKHDSVGERTKSVDMARENNANQREQRNNLRKSVGERIRSVDMAHENDTAQRAIQGNQRDRTGDSSLRTERRADRPQVDRERSSTDIVDRTRVSRVAPDSRTAITNDLHVRDTDGRRDLRVHRYEPVRPTQIIVRDRPYIRDTYPDRYTYVGRHDRIYTRSITPDYYLRVCYNRGSWLSVGVVYPYYQRKYVFVSLGGYWPAEYSYRRYYWYGYHPYQWYGYYPVAREVGSDVNYYYTYNYYSDDSSTGYETGNVLSPEYFDSTATLQSIPEPAEATLADTYFEEGVTAFEKGRYDLAIEKFSKAMALAPNDMILPFAYSQALFAAGKYSESAEVLRVALSKVKPEKEGVFYPRGLYPNDEILLAQLDKLAEEADEFSFDADLQLLLGYHLLGIGELDQALTPLKNACLDMDNEGPANVLLNLLLKIKVNDITSGIKIEPEKAEPEEIEPNIIELNETEPVSQNMQSISFVDSAAKIKTEKEAIENNEDMMLSEKIAANEPTHKKAKEGILLATLFVLVGSTGLGHLLHR